MQFVDISKAKMKLRAKKALSCMCVTSAEEAWKGDLQHV